MKEFQPFEHEVMASQHEKVVDYNLSESGVHPLLLRELLTDSPEYIETLLGRSAGEMNEFTQTCLTATNDGLPAINTLDTRVTEPILIRQVIHPEMTNVFLGKKSIDEMMEYLTSYLTQQEKEMAD